MKNRKDTHQTQEELNQRESTSPDPKSSNLERPSPRSWTKERYAICEGQDSRVWVFAKGRDKESGLEAKRGGLATTITATHARGDTNELFAAGPTHTACTWRMWDTKAVTRLGTSVTIALFEVAGTHTTQDDVLRGTAVCPRTQAAPQAIGSTDAFADATDALDASQVEGLGFPHADPLAVGTATVIVLATHFGAIGLADLPWVAAAIAGVPHVLAARSRVCKSEHRTRLLADQLGIAATVAHIPYVLTTGLGLDKFEHRARLFGLGSLWLCCEQEDRSCQQV